MDNGDATALQFAVMERPEAAIFKGWHLFNIAGTVCCDCGRITFTAIGNLAEAWETFEASGREVALPDSYVLDE